MIPCGTMQCIFYAFCPFYEFLGTVWNHKISQIICSKVIIDSFPWSIDPISEVSRQKKSKKFSRRFQQFFGRPKNFSKIFWKIFGAKMTNPARPKNLRARPGRLSARAKNLRRDLKFLDARLKSLERSLKNLRLPKLGVLFLRGTSENHQYI